MTSKTDKPHDAINQRADKITDPAAKVAFLKISNSANTTEPTIQLLRAMGDEYDEPRLRHAADLLSGATKQGRPAAPENAATAARYNALLAEGLDPMQARAKVLSEAPDRSRAYQVIRRESEKTKK